MELTPRDIQQKQFNDAFRGYSHEEVDAFLDEVAEAFSRIYRENQNAQLKLRETDKELALAKQTEGMLKRTLLTAQQTVDETIAEARTRAQEIEKVANAKAAEIMAEAQARIMEMRATLEGLKRYEREYRDRLRAFMENQLEVLARPVEQPPDNPVVPPAAPPAEWPQSVQEVHSAAEPDLRPAPLPPRRQAEESPATVPEPPARDSGPAEPAAPAETQDLLAPTAPPIASRNEEGIPVQSEMHQAGAPAQLREPEPAHANPLPEAPEVEKSSPYASDPAEAGPSVEQVVDLREGPAQKDPALAAEGVNGEAGRRPDKSKKEIADEKSISELFWGED